MDHLLREYLVFFIGIMTLVVLFIFLLRNEHKKSMKIVQRELEKARIQGEIVSIYSSVRDYIEHNAMTCGKETLKYLKQADTLFYNRFSIEKLSWISLLDNESGVNLAEFLMELSEASEELEKVVFDVSFLTNKVYYVYYPVDAKKEEIKKRVYVKYLQLKLFFKRSVSEETVDGLKNLSIQEAIGYA